MEIQMDNVFIQLFIEFFQIGLFAVGGGPATIPFLMDIPSRHDWYTKADVVNMLAISESTPGSCAMIRPVVTGLIATAVYGIFQTALFTAKDGSFQLPVFPLILCAVFFVAMNLKKLSKIHPFFWMVCGAVAGLVFKM